MNVHDRMDDLASLAVAGGLSAAEQSDLDAHVAACPDCAALLREARDFQAWMRGAVAPDRPPAGLEDRIIARLGARKPAFRRLPGGLLLRWAAGLVAVAGLVLIGGRFTAASNLEATVLSLESGSFETAYSVFPPTDLRIDGSHGGQGGETRALGLADGRRSLGRIESLKAVDAGTLAADMESGRWSGVRQNGVPLEQLKEANRRVLELSRELESRRRVAESEAMSKSAIEESDKANAAKAPAIFNVETNVNVPGAPITDGLPLKTEFELRADGGPQVSTLAASYAPDPLPRQAGQKLVRNGKLSLEVVAYEETHAKLVVIVTDEKGYVADASTEKLQNGKTRATVVLRVPSERFDAVVARIRALGKVQNQSVSVEDMTKAYADVETRLAAKQAFLERLKKLLAEGKGDVKQLLEVEVQMGATLEEIDRMKGELRFYDNRISLSTITLEIFEKDLGRPFEIVETLQAKVGIVAADVDAVHAAAQKVFLDAGGRVLDVKLTRQNDGSAQGRLSGRVDAAKFPAVREALRKLGHVETDTVDRRKTAQGQDPKADAPVRVEEATVDVTVSSPAEHVSRRATLTVETADVETGYVAARRAIEAAGGRVTEGQLLRRADGLQAIVRGRLDADRHAATLESFRLLGKPREQSASQALPPAGVLVREQGELELLLHTPPLLIGEEQGLVKTVRDTFSRSVAGALWSIEKLFVGLALAGPWIAVGALGWLLWRRRPKRSKLAG